MSRGRKPLALLVTEGQCGGSPQFQAVLNQISVARTGPGRARTKPGRVLADKAYGTRASRASCAGAYRRDHPRAS